MTSSAGSPDVGSLPGPPEGPVRALFGKRAATAERFAHHLAGSAVERGLIGPREVARIWDRHILNCAVVHPLLPEGVTAADVGSGAGLPGLAVAIARPDVHVTLVEPLQRRVTWLEEVLADLEVPNVTVRRARAEELAGTLAVDAVMARAVAGLPTLARWCLPLLRPGGTLLALKGRSAREEAEAADAELRSMGADSWRVETCGEGTLDVPTTVVVVVRSTATAAGASRRAASGEHARRSSRRRSRPPRPRS